VITPEQVDTMFAVTRQAIEDTLAS
jgi:hypothetical protein